MSQTSFTPMVQTLRQMILCLLSLRLEKEEMGKNQKVEAAASKSAKMGKNQKVEAAASMGKNQKVEAAASMGKNQKVEAAASKSAKM